MNEVCCYVYVCISHMRYERSDSNDECAAGRVFTMGVFEFVCLFYFCSVKRDFTHLSSFMMDAEYENEQYSYILRLAAKNQQTNTNIRSYSSFWSFNMWIIVNIWLSTKMLSCSIRHSSFFNLQHYCIIDMAIFYISLLLFDIPLSYTIEL